MSTQSTGSTMDVVDYVDLMDGPKTFTEGQLPIAHFASGLMISLKMSGLLSSLIRCAYFSPSW